MHLMIQQLHNASSCENEQFAFVKHMKFNIHEVITWPKQVLGTYLGLDWLLVNYQREREKESVENHSKQISVSLFSIAAIPTKSLPHIENHFSSFYPTIDKGEILYLQERKKEKRKTEIVLYFFNTTPASSKQKHIFPGRHSIILMVAQINGNENVSFSIILFFSHI